MPSPRSTVVYRLRTGGVLSPLRWWRHRLGRHRLWKALGRAPRPVAHLRPACMWLMNADRSSHIVDDQLGTMQSIKRYSTYTEINAQYCQHIWRTSWARPLLGPYDPFLTHIYQRLKYNCLLFRRTALDATTCHTLPLLTPGHAWCTW